jgi:tRNA modification GTPase
MSDTVAAVATAYGEGGIGIIRISGELSGEILDKLFRPYKGLRGNNGVSSAVNSSDCSPVSGTQGCNPTNYLPDYSPAGSARNCSPASSAQECSIANIPPDYSPPVNNPKQHIPNRLMRYGHIVNPLTDELIDEAMAVFMRGPHSYTGEDTAELQCHGSVVSLRKTLEAVFSLGALPAPPGEFTKRAFLNGRIDLAQAEAVVELISSRTGDGFGSALGQLQGRLSARVDEVQAILSDAIAESVVNLDYPDDDPDSNTNEHARLSIGANLEQAEKLLSSLLMSAKTGRMIRDGISLVLTGRPNAGKSSLMNALLRASRAIVSELPGTTRDSIDEYLDLRGIPVRLTDTAGIRSARDGLEAQGIERARRALASADMVVFVVDGSAAICGEDYDIAKSLSGQSCVILINKSDLPVVAELSGLKALLPDAAVLCVSAVTGEGITELEDFFVGAVYGGQLKQGESLLVTSTRHVDALRRAANSIGSAKTALNDGLALDFVEISMSEARDSLGEITGAVVTEDILDRVFSRFCVGK